VLGLNAGRVRGAGGRRLKGMDGFVCFSGVKEGFGYVSLKKISWGIQFCLGVNMALHFF